MLFWNSWARDGNRRKYWAVKFGTGEKILVLQREPALIVLGFVLPHGYLVP